MLVTNIHDRDEDCHHEDPYMVKVSPDLWAYAIKGGPFTDNEIQRLKEKYQGGRDGQI